MLICLKSSKLQWNSLSFLKIKHTLINQWNLLGITMFLGTSDATLMDSECRLKN